MPVKIMSVAVGSLACRAGIKTGDTIVSINGRQVNDVLDYRFLISDSRLSITLSDGSVHTIKKGQYADIGLEFNSYLMDGEKTCRNKCVFCFIDQMPPGMRETLYFKDDDSRLSFLFGNYITLTNLSDQDVRRILDMHISPVNVSVHTTDPALRVQMMKNKRAGDSLRYLEEFAKGGIRLNIQLVLCPGINDGEHLQKSLADLGKLYPAAQSIACVPVGLTKYRAGLPAIAPYTREDAREVIGIIDRFREEFFALHREHIAFAADEFYLKAGLPIPDEDYYGGYEQLTNGVGLMRKFYDEVMDELETMEDCPTDNVALITGEAAGSYMKDICATLKKKKVNCKVYVAKNSFFGQNVTVAGLLTGEDIIEALSGLKEKTLLIPGVMLRSEGDKFLDDVTVAELEQKLNVRVKVVDIDGGDFVKAITEMANGKWQVEERGAEGYNET